MIEFIKSIGRWFKRKPRTPASKYSDLLNSTLVSRSKEIESVVRASNPLLSYMALSPFERELHNINARISDRKSELLKARRQKKKVSHIQKQLEVLVARKLELEGK